MERIKDKNEAKCHRLENLCTEYGGSLRRPNIIVRPDEDGQLSIVA